MRPLVGGLGVGLLVLALWYFFTFTTPENVVAMTLVSVPVGGFCGVLIFTGFLAEDR